MHASVTDSPPAYSSDVPPSRSASSHLPPPTVDQVHIFSRHEDIKGTLNYLFFLSSPYLCLGTYYIDPNVPSQALRQKCKRKSPQMLHASFRTRKSNISIDLGTTGDVYDAKKANVAVATHKGDIKINLVCSWSSTMVAIDTDQTRKLPTPSVRPLGLDVTSRKGKCRGGKGGFFLLTHPFQETSYFSFQKPFRESFISRREKVKWLFYLLSQASWKSSRHPIGRRYLWLPPNIFPMERTTPVRPLYASFTHERVASWLVWVAVTNMYRNQISGRNLVATFVEISSKRY
jgi:hypothetical protein